VNVYFVIVSIQKYWSSSFINKFYLCSYWGQLLNKSQRKILRTVCQWVVRKKRRKRNLKVS